MKSHLATDLVGAFVAIDFSFTLVASIWGIVSISIVETRCTFKGKIEMKQTYSKPTSKSG